MTALEPPVCEEEIGKITGSQQQCYIYYKQVHAIMTLGGKLLYAPNRGCALVLKRPQFMCFSRCCLFCYA